MDAIVESYRDSIKIWHPDRFESDPRLRAKAEEQFKNIQVSYRELLQHSLTRKEPTKCEGASDSGVEWAEFNNHQGCRATPNITADLEKLVRMRSKILTSESLIAAIDLSSTSDDKQVAFDHFLLLSSQSLIVNSSFTTGRLLYRNISPNSLSLRDHRKGGRLGFWQTSLEWAAGTEQKYTLAINDSTGKHFYSVSAPVHDDLKKVIFQFLLKRSKA